MSDPKPKKHSWPKPKLLKEKQFTWRIDDLESMKIWDLISELQRYEAKLEELEAISHHFEVDLYASYDGTIEDKDLILHSSRYETQEEASAREIAEVRKREAKEKEKLDAAAKKEAEERALYRKLKAKYEVKR